MKYIKPCYQKNDGVLMHVHTLHMGGSFTLHPHAATDVDSWNRPDSVHKMCFKFQNELDIERDLQILSKKKKN